jgi:serpin B
MPWPFTRRHSVVLADRPETASLSTHRFAFDLFSNLVRREPLRNVVLSPCSVLFCLGMMYEGAIGETRQAMAETLGISDLDESSRGSAIARLKSELQSSSSDVQLLLANSLWCNREVHVRPDYIARMLEDFNARVESADFSSGETIRQINVWVRENTGGKIASIVDNLPALARLVALNAIYFKGLWASPFQGSMTHDELFTTVTGQPRKVPMMRQLGRFRYLEGPQFQAVALPYQGERVAMYVLLPAQGRALADFEKTLSSGEWRRWIAQFNPVLGLVGLPRFAANYETCLNGSLQDMGMAIAFDRQGARFDGISVPPPENWIDLILHRSMVEVNEEGTEAAAVTGAIACLSSAQGQRPERTFKMIVDRPFVFAIRDEQSGALLFLGAITEPIG